MQSTKSTYFSGHIILRYFGTTYPDIIVINIIYCLNNFLFKFIIINIYCIVKWLK